jgi:hypothetical protein
VFEQDLLWVELNTNDRVSTVLDGWYDSFTLVLVVAQNLEIVV